MKEHDVKPDKGGDRGGKMGVGKMGSGQGDFGKSDLDKGYKKIRTVPVQESGKGPRPKIEK